MKRSIALVLAFIALPTAAQAVYIEKKGRFASGVPALACTIQVDFGSANNGPDVETWQAIQNYLTESTVIDEAGAWGWGREGEFSLCLRIEDPAVAKTVLDDLTKLLPAVREPHEGWTRVKAGSGKKP